jgi:hypothetical protein
MTYTITHTGPSGESVWTAEEPGEAVDLFRAVRREQRFGVLLLTQDGKVLARDPPIPEFVDYVGKTKISGSSLAVTIPADVVRVMELRPRQAVRVRISIEDEE